MSTSVATTEPERRAWRMLGDVADPEIPVISVVDLGIVRELHARPDGGIEVGLSPTYSGCPATVVIRERVVQALEQGGFAPVIVREVLSPPWSSDWISTAGRERLARYGIAPPAQAVSSVRALHHAPAPVRCPRCGSARTSEVSAFGSTPCKALHRCEDCREPFEYFKCI